MLNFQTTICLSLSADWSYSLICRIWNVENQTYVFLMSMDYVNRNDAKPNLGKKLPLLIPSTNFDEIWYIEF